MSDEYKPRYSGPGATGVCVCGHKWDEHHLGFVMNDEYRESTGESYVPEECEHYGFNETGGLDSDGNLHCEHYQDSGLVTL